MSLTDGKKLTHEELKQWLNRPCPPKLRLSCAHDVELLRLGAPSGSVYGCTECGAEWEVP